MTKWLHRYQVLDEAGLVDVSSAPHSSPTMTDTAVVARIEDLRRTHKWTARQIHLHLPTEGHQIAAVTVARWLRRLGIPGAVTWTPPAPPTAPPPRSWPATPATWSTWA